MGLPDWRRFFVRLRQQTGRIAKLCGGFANEKRAKKMRQDGRAEFIRASLSYTSIIIPMRQKIQYVENISFPLVWSSLGKH